MSAPNQFAFKDCTYSTYCGRISEDRNMEMICGIYRRYILKRICGIYRWYILKGFVVSTSRDRQGGDILQKGLGRECEL